MVLAWKVAELPLAPALRVFPTLKRFAPAFAPRGILNPPGQSPPIEERTIMSLSSLYHDLGVIVFAGTSVRRVKRIGKILRKAVAVGGPPRIMSTTYNCLNFMSYKLPVEDWHIDTTHKSEEGYLSTEALVDLGKKAAFKWGEQTVRNMKDADGNSPPVSFREHHVRITQGLHVRGVIHQTANGPRRLPVEALMRITKLQDQCGVIMRIFFYTAVTGHYVGEVKLHLNFYSTVGDKEPLHPGLSKAILDKGPREKLCTKTDRNLVKNGLWKLEDQVWYGRASDAQRRLQTLKPENTEMLGKS
ncbi:hypothetical protein G7Z17_g5270 [Cylindrodendrum hubeiense]|uniref:Uncharacterized protein n=1 Tax=Cylindrodendrum hubeiense TaxID=595255 RepID=A0A9P5H723_9HYPO|nr:hypothetical protein G7Z17_g5270 [Cylindrodendrum hubeiense]